MIDSKENLNLRRKVAKINMSADRDLSVDANATCRYLICSTQRSGSTLLADLLENTGVAGCPMEYFNDVYIEVYCAQKGTSNFKRQAYVDEIEQRRTSFNGVFGAKAHLMQLRMWFTGAPEQSLTNFLRSFDRLVFIRRRDKLGQAISFYRALLSGRWTSQHAALANREEVPPPFNPKAITATLNEVLASEAAWQSLFTTVGIKPLEVLYEDLADGPQSVLEDVFDAIPIKERRKVWPSPKLQRQRDEISEELRGAYMKFLNDR